MGELSRLRKCVTRGSELLHQRGCQKLASHIQKEQMLTQHVPLEPILTVNGIEKVLRMWVEIL